MEVLHPLSSGERVDNNVVCDVLSRLPMFVNALVKYIVGGEPSVDFARGTR